MRTFKDKTGNEWELELNGLAIRNIDNTDYSALVDGDYKISRRTEGSKFWDDGIYDRALITAMVWVAIRGQNKQAIEAAREKINKTEEREDATAEEAFVSLLDGPAVRRAYNAFMEELSDFFPERRTVLMKLIQLSGEVEKRTSDQIIKKLDALGPKMDKLIETELDKAEATVFGP